jgi:hypothetical protein
MASLRGLSEGSDLRRVRMIRAFRVHSLEHFFVRRGVAVGINLDEVGIELALSRDGRAAAFPERDERAGGVADDVVSHFESSVSLI